MGFCYSICSGCCGDFFLWLTRIWGLVTVVVVWGVTAETVFYGHLLGYYLLAVAILLTFLEVVFGVTYLVLLCVSADSCLKQCWDCILWLDDWKKGTLYLGLSVPCFIQPVDVWLAIIAGILIMFCAFFYILKTFKTRVDRDRVKLAQTPSYDKFDDIQEDMDMEDDDDDDNVITHHGTITILDDIGDQQEILEV